MHRYFRQIYLGNIMVILGGSTLAVVSGLIAQTVSSDNDLTRNLVVISTIVGVAGGILTAIGGTIISLERIRVENLRSSYSQMATNRNLTHQVATLRQVFDENQKVGSEEIPLRDDRGGYHGREKSR